MTSFSYDIFEEKHCLRDWFIQIFPNPNITIYFLYFESNCTRQIIETGNVHAVPYRMVPFLWIIGGLTMVRLMSSCAWIKCLISICRNKAWKQSFTCRSLADETSNWVQLYLFAVEYASFRGTFLMRDISLLVPISMTG